MFMDEEKNERFLRAMEVLAKAEIEKVNRASRRLGLALILIPVATFTWGVPLSVILWRAAFGN